MKKRGRNSNKYLEMVSDDKEWVKMIRISSPKLIGHLV